MTKRKFYDFLTGRSIGVARGAKGAMAPLNFMSNYKTVSKNQNINFFAPLLVHKSLFLTFSQGVGRASLFKFFNFQIL